MVTRRGPLLLVALTLMTTHLQTGARGMQLYEVEAPSEPADRPVSLSQPILHKQPRLAIDAAPDMNLVVDDRCGDPAPSDARHLQSKETVTPAHAADAAGRAGRLQRTTSPWEAVLPGVLQQGKSRKKRAALYWPDGSVFIAEFFFVIPIEAPTGVSIPFTIDVPYEFTLPNITTDFLKRESLRGRDDRLNLYGLVEKLFQRFGLDGRACVLRAVCERASTSLEGAGMLGEVLTTILTASLSVASEGIYEYILAEHNGRTHGNCWALYPACPVSLFNWLE